MSRRSAIYEIPDPKGKDILWQDNQLESVVGAIIPSAVNEMHLEN